MTVPSPARGTTVISEKAVRKVVQRAAAEAVDEPARAVGASAAVAGRRVTADVRVPLPYPAHLSDETRRLREHVLERARTLTGLQMSTVRVAVTRLTQTAAPVDPAPSAEAHAAGPRRWWSQRRRPTGLVLALAAGIALAVTVDVFRVHLAGARPAAWRRSTVDWLSDHGPGDLSVTLAGTGCALCGLWLFVLALTPGRRRQLTLAAGSQDWSAAIDRSAVASLLRDAVHDVPGTQNVRVRAGRRRVTVRGEIAFGDCEGARAQARETAARTLADCGLHRPPRLRITLRPAAVWQPPAPRDTAPAPAEAAA